MAEMFFRRASAFRKKGDSDAQSQADFPASDLNGPQCTANNLLATALNVSHSVEVQHHNNELISAHASDGVRIANRGQKTLPHSRKEDVPASVPERIVDLLKVIDVDEKDRNSSAVVLPVDDRLPETLVKQRAIG
jgi:hypothetical protein